MIDKSLWNVLTHKYTNVAFDAEGGQVSGTHRPGRKHLCAIEPFPIMQISWKLSTINRYETFITCNRKFVEKYKDEIKAKIYIFEGGVITDNIPDTSIPDSFTPYDKKIKGVCIIGRKGHRAYTGNVYFLREEFAKKLPGVLETHIYSPTIYGGSHYQGVFDSGPWGKPAIETVDRYLFYFCPENTYHPLWSCGYLCEKIFRAFKAKTVPIYLGCYNVEEYIPKDLFIDFRDFYVPGVVMSDGKSTGEYSGVYSRTDYKKVAEFLENFPKERYIEMTEKAFEWQKSKGLSNYNSYIDILESLD